MLHYSWTMFCKFIPNKFFFLFMNSFLKLALFILPVVYFSSCSLSKDPQRRQIQLLQKGKITEDTSYVYWLPYAEGATHRLVQGYFSRHSHKNRAALDFKMKPGTAIHAARAGVVSRVVEENDKGGWNRKYRQYGNLVTIQHSDGSRAGYWHLQKDGALVNLGDSVKKGQIIALSGKTGFTAFPHLHFIVWRSGGGGPIGTRFLTAKGKKYLKPLKRYTGER